MKYFLFLTLFVSTCLAQSTNTAVLFGDNVSFFVNYETRTDGWKVVETIVCHEPYYKKDYVWYCNSSPNMSISNYLSDVDTTQQYWFLNFPAGRLARKLMPNAKLLYVQ